MKLIRNIFMAGAMLFSATACEFEDTNINPAAFAPEDVPLRALMPTALTQVGYNVGGLGGRMPGIIMQHFIGIDAQQIPYTSYVIGEGDLNNLWAFGLYTGSIRLSSDISTNAEAFPHYNGISKIIMAQSLGLTTSFWGDIPYSEAMQGQGNFVPAFDTQEQIYASIQTLLDEAIVLLQQEAADGDVGSDDIVFDGDADSWIKVARALKARYYMHLTRRNSDAATQALAALNAGALESNDDNANVPFGSGPEQANPYAQFGAQRPNTMAVDERFFETLDSKGDPRVDIYMDFSGDSYQFFTTQTGGLFWSSNDSPVPIISFAEVKFLEAEAKLRTGDTAGAEEALFDAIVASFIQLGVPATDAAFDYLDAYGSFNGSTTEENLEQIINEKYMALFAQGEAEVWVDYRRTGYPALTPAVDGDAGGLNPGGEIPRRFIYPRDERITNEANMQAAIDRQGGGLLSDDLWAFKP